MQQIAHSDNRGIIYITRRASLFENFCSLTDSANSGLCYEKVLVLPIINNRTEKTCANVFAILDYGFFKFLNV